MARPKAPTFATETNYPAGPNPWNGQPLRLAPPSDYFTPNTGAAPEEINYELGTICDYLGNANAWNSVAPGQAGLDWRPFSPVSTTPYTAFMAGWWDPSNFQWLIAAGNSSGTGTCDVFMSKGLGDADYGTAVSNGAGITVGGRITDVFYDGTQFWAALIKSSDSSLCLYYCSPGGAWTLADNFLAGTATITDAKFDQRGSTWYVVVSSSTALIGTVYYVFGGGTTWTGPSLAVNGTGAGTCVANNGTTSVAFAVATSPANYGTAGTLDGGTAWTQHSASFMNHTNEEPIGVVWSSADNLFILVTVYGTTPSAMATYTSPDGLTWTLVSTLTSSFTPDCLAVTGYGCLAATTHDFGGGNCVMYSVDAGATWHRSGCFLTHTSVTLQPCRVYASPVGFWAMNCGTSRFSRLYGLQPALR